jgi:hypothetical protein
MRVLTRSSLGPIALAFTFLSAPAFANVLTETADLRTGGGVELTATVSPGSVTYGEQFSITITVANNTAEPISGDLWLETRRNGSPGVFVEYIGRRTVPANRTETRVITHTVPRVYEGEPILPGDYTVTVNVGDFQSQTVLASDSYDLTVTANRVAGFQEGGGDDYVLMADVTPGSGTYGEEFAVDITFTNNTDEPVTTDFWLTTVLQGNDYVFRLNFEEFANTVVPGGASGTYVDRHVIPRRAFGLPIRPGTYTVTMYAGDFETDTVIASDSYNFTVTANRIYVEPVAEAASRTAGAPASATTSAPAEVVVSPNPFASRTSVSFTVSEATDVRLAVYDVLGREVAVLVDGQVEAGAHTAVFDASALAAGTYVYRLVAEGQVETGRLTVAR